MPVRSAVARARACRPPADDRPGSRTCPSRCERPAPPAARPTCRNSVLRARRKRRRRRPAAAAAASPRPAAPALPRLRRRRERAAAGGGRAGQGSAVVSARSTSSGTSNSTGPGRPRVSSVQQRSSVGSSASTESARPRCFGQRGAGGELVVLVVVAGAQAAAGRGDLAADEQHRHGVGEGGRQRRGGVEDAGAAHRQADAGPAGGAGVAVGHERRRLFVAGQEVADRRLPIEGVVDRRELAAGIAEDAADAVLGEPAHQQVGGGNRRLRVAHGAFPPDELSSAPLPLYRTAEDVPPAARRV